MPANPLLGVLFHWIGGFASASFYVPYKRIRRLSWEVYWLVGGVFSWIIAPWVFAALRTEHLLAVLSSTPASTLVWCWFWGVMWGFGGLTFGLTMRYLGMSLGMAMVLGLTMVIGTLGPPLFRGALPALASTPSGLITFIGIAFALLGVGIVARAGRRKERESKLTPDADAAIAEFDFKKGVIVALFSGAMSSCFAFGLDAGAPIRAASLEAGTSPLSQGLPVLCVVLAGGFTTNVIWCIVLMMRNKSAGQLFRPARSIGDSEPTGTLLVRNYVLSALGGTLWYFQFFFYTMGESQMGRYSFSSWTIHMSSIIIFATVWGLGLKEWRGAGKRSLTFLTLGLLVLIGSTVVIGWGNALVAQG
jgi:L-rhamnose-H+ transport protein